MDAFDRFQWDSFMEMWVEGSHLADKYRDAEIFVDEYKNQVRDFLEYVNVYVADLEQQGWRAAYRASGQ